MCFGAAERLTARCRERKNMILTPTSSMSSLAKVMLGYFSSSLAKWGPMMRQGPHQVAQKSTTVGLDEAIYGVRQRPTLSHSW